MKLWHIGVLVGGILALTTWIIVTHLRVQESSAATRAALRAEDIAAERSAFEAEAAAALNSGNIPRATQKCRAAAAVRGETDASVFLRAPCKAFAPTAGEPSAGSAVEQ